MKDSVNFYSNSWFSLFFLQFMFQSDVSPDLAGMLQKKGRRLKAWKQRYFEIQGANMYYFKNERVTGMHTHTHTHTHTFFIQIS